MFHRHRREGSLNVKQERLVREQFVQDLDDRIRLLLPVTDHRRVEAVTAAALCGLIGRSA